MVVICIVKQTADSIVTFVGDPWCIILDFLDFAFAFWVMIVNFAILYTVPIYQTIHRFAVSNLAKSSLGKTLKRVYPSTKLRILCGEYSWNSQ
jgi:hypothetical protein